MMIANVTKVSERTVQRMAHLWKQTGLVEQKPVKEDIMFMDSLGVQYPIELSI
jgi:hypothetical protein